MSAEYACTADLEPADRQEYARAYEIGDEIAFEAPPDGQLMSAEVVGFSTLHAGYPVIEAPDELLEYFEGAPETIAIEQERHVPPTEVEA